MSEPPLKDAAKAISQAPTELDIAEAGGDQGPLPDAREAETVALKQASLEPAEGVPAGPIPGRTAETYLGYIIDGRFHVESVIATGGMGVVYKARHRVIDKPVAIKILRPELVDNRDITERFLTEAQAASSVGNEHIVDVTDYGELPDGATYIVMEFLEGESLGRRLRRDADPLLVSEVESIARQLAEGLHQAHEAQIIHRDLKPDNVFLVTRGRDPNFVKILDFGIAKVQSSQNQVTRAGRIFGTPHYMSPEQARGEPVDRRSDIYSFGVMLYQMLAGRLPFDGENPLGILTQHMYVEPTPLCDLCDEKVPAGLEAIVLKCMSKSVTERYETLESVEADLLRQRAGLLPIAALDLLQIKTTTRSLRKRLRKAARKGPRLVLPLLSLVGVGSVALGLYKAAPDLLTFAPPEAAPEPTAMARKPPKPRQTTVALVLSPIDAHVFHGRRDLGTMPLNVRIRDGQQLDLEVRRQGYVSQRITIDGSNDRALVELAPMPGTSPPAEFDVPGASVEARVISIEDGGVQTAGQDAPLPGASAQGSDAGLLKAPSAPATSEATAPASPARPEATAPSPEPSAPPAAAASSADPPPTAPLAPPGSTEVRPPGPPPQE